MILLFVSNGAALENLHNCTVSQRCMKDINTFLLDLNQDKPKEYAVLSKC